MKLSERLARLEEPPVAPDRRRTAAAPDADPVAASRRRTRAKVVAAAAPAAARARSPHDLRRTVAAAVDGVLDDPTLSADARRAMAAELASDILGYGPLDPLLADPSVDEVMCNAHDEVWVERRGRIERTDVAFSDGDHYRTIIERIVAGVGRRLDESSPMVDARLPDGSRVNAVIPPLTRHAPALTIRKFRSEPLAVRDLVRLGTVSLEMALFIEACVRGRQNILISGGTGSGKTTTLNAVSAFVPPGERIVTIEDVMELRLHQPHVVGLEHRPSNAEGRGEVTIRELVRNALRMRPDRIVVGEVRGGEALDMLQAMNTGHDGSMTTVHANSARDALSRLETMVLMAGFDLPVRAIREQVAGAIDLIVQQERSRDGSRRVVEVCEVQGLEGDTVVLQRIFQWDHGASHLAMTGMRPRLLDRLAERGVELPPPWHTSPAPAAPASAPSGGTRQRRRT